jgi:outer membrane protein TolC
VDLRVKGEHLLSPSIDRSYALAHGSSPQADGSSLDAPQLATRAYRREKLGAPPPKSPFLRESIMVCRATSSRNLAPALAIAIATLLAAPVAAAAPTAPAAPAPGQPAPQPVSASPPAAPPAQAAPKAASGSALQPAGPAVPPPPPGAPAAVTSSVPAPPAPDALSIEQAVQLILTRNERARISDLNVNVADAAVEKARAGFLPILTLNGNDTTTAVVAAGQPANVGAGSLVLSQPLLNASAYPLYSQAKALADAQRAQNTDDKRLLSFSAANAFFTVLSASAVVEAAQRQLENAQANVNDTQARADAQLNSTNDVTRARIDVASAARELESDKGGLASDYVQLAFLLNTPVTGTLAPPGTTLGAALQPLGSVEDLVRLALERRPDVQVDKYASDAAHHFASEPMMRLIPTIGVNGTISGTTNAPQTTHVWNQETVAGVLTWTIYDAGSRYADKHSRDAQAEIADLNLQQLVRNVDAQVRATTALLAAAQAEFQVAGQARDAAQQNVEETAILYRQGLAKAIELIDANDSRFTAEVNYAGAQYSMAVAYLNLRQALGLEPLGTELK